MPIRSVVAPVEALFTRFQRSGEAADLDASIDAALAELRLPPISERRRFAALNNLNSALQLRYGPDAPTARPVRRHRHAQQSP